jgi:hypothetical protein
MSSIATSIETDSGYQGLGWGGDLGYMECLLKDMRFLYNDGNFLKLDCGRGCMILSIIKFIELYT